MQSLDHISTSLRLEIQREVACALAEDVGTGDLTAQLIAAEAGATGRVITRQEAVLCGTAWFDAAFHMLDAGSTVVWHAQDGERIEPGQSLCSIVSNARALLTAERTALNFLQLLSGTATTVRRFVDVVEGTRARIVDTRKTLPGLRLAQKYAVRAGGGLNHRIGLYDGILIKENHIIAAGGIRPALEKAQAIAPAHAFVEIEVETLDQLREALDCGATMVLLDNMSVAQMADAVQLTAGRAELEASGGISIERVREIAEAGVDRISIGTLTKDVQSVDFSLRHVEN
ncbi:MAG: carboxylating nicotinate-nucleotide diphosphorylase [Rhodocyclaceae bacterium]